MLMMMTTMVQFLVSMRTTTRIPLGERYERCRSMWSGYIHSFIPFFFFDAMGDSPLFLLLLPISCPLCQSSGRWAPGETIPTNRSREPGITASSSPARTLSY